MENGSSDTSSDDESVLDETDNKSDFERTKRSLEGTRWCGVDLESASSTLDVIRKYPQYWGNPKFGTKMQLYSATSYFIGVYPDGKVRGTQDRNDIHTHLELINAGHEGHVRIQGMLTLLYVAMNKKGRLYAEANMWKESTIFIESLDGNYNNYLSKAFAHLGWYLGIKKSGKGKKGPQTKFGQKATRFLPVRSKFQ